MEHIKYFLEDGARQPYLIVNSLHVSYLKEDGELVLICFSNGDQVPVEGRMHTIAKKLWDKGEKP